MGFVCTVDPSAAIAFEMASDGHEHAVRATVGHDDEAGTTFSVLVVLAPRVGGGHELVVAITEHDMQGRTLHRYLNGRDTTTRIHRSMDRASILSSILRALDLLLKRHAPEVVYRVVSLSGAPTRALAKHMAIHDVFFANGYELEELEPGLGTRAWLMKRAV